MRCVCKCILILLITWSVSFGLFIIKTLRYNILDEHTFVANGKKYNAVILTGGRHRISKAIRFINENNTNNIFISGVHQKTRLRDILINADSPKNVSIILEKQATNTHENAVEVSKWAKNNNIDEILLITSDYHMQRSMLELAYFDNKLKILPCAIRSEYNFSFFKNCFKEFHKVAFTCLNFLL